VNELVNYLQFSLLLLFVAVAVVLGLQSDRISKRGKAVIVSGALLSIVSFPGPILLVDKLASNFNMLRFGQYTFPLIVMAAAAGIVILVDADLRISRRNLTPVLSVVVVLLVFSMGFLAVSNDFVASDNPTVERQFYTYYLSESETDGLRTVSDLSGNGLMSDEVACKYISYSGSNSGCTILQADTDRGTLLSSEQTHLLVVRTTELDRRGLQVFPTDEYDPNPSYLYSEAYLSADDPTWNDLDRRNKVFATDAVAAFTNSSQNGSRTGTVNAKLRST
jgi:hypothetical protein